MTDKIFTAKTSSGFEYKIDKDNLDDMEVFNDLMIMEDPETPQVKRIFATNKVFRTLLGEDQKKALDEYLIKRDGKVRISVYQQEMMEIFRAMDDSKKK